MYWIFMKRNPRLDPCGDFLTNTTRMCLCGSLTNGPISMFSSVFFVWQLTWSSWILAIIKKICHSIHEIFLFVIDTTNHRARHASLANSFHSLLACGINFFKVLSPKVTNSSILSGERNIILEPAPHRKGGSQRGCPGRRWSLTVRRHANPVIHSSVYL